MSDTLTRTASELALSLTEADLSPRARQLVANAYLDAIGCAIAGAESEDAVIVRRWVAAQGGNREASIIGSSGVAAPAAAAALVNGTAAHALDLDDFSPTMMHPSVCLVPALLALGEREGLSGSEIGVGYAAGFEVFARLCKGMNPEHYALGYHSTCTVGMVAVAAAAGRLLGLDAGQIAHAMAIAASSAGGIRKNFGSMVKPLHAGNAAYHGIAAAELAGLGFTGDAAILDGPSGFVGMLSGEETSLARVEEHLTRQELELDVSGISFKRFACCGGVHASLDAALELRESEAIDPDEIAGVVAHTNKWAPEILIHHVATTPAEGRFCVEYAVAVTLIDGDAGVQQFTPERVADERVQDLSRRVDVQVDPDLPVGFTNFPGVIEITMADGRTFSKRVDLAKGGMTDPLTADEMEQKFRGCALVEFDAEGTEAILALARDIFAVESVGRLAQALSPSLDPAPAAAA